MANGTVIYWNGLSGWIKQTGVEELPTRQSYDVMCLLGEVYASDMPVGANVTFTVTDAEPWFAQDVQLA